MKNEALLQYIHGRSCEILGLGVSNLPLAKQLHEMGVSLTIRDKKSPEELGDDARELLDDGARFFWGNDCFNTLSADVIFRSPGIRPDSAGLPNAVKRGAELTSEMELFLHLTSATTFAVTGSDGKTTSTTLTGKFLHAEALRRGNCHTYVGGNIGVPLLDRLPLITDKDFVAAELSSFQLMTIKKSPRYAAITNLSPNHLDWHRGMDEYRQAKENIIGENTIRFVTNAECSDTWDIAQKQIRQRQQRGSSLPAIYLISSQRSSFEELFSNGAMEHDRAIYEKDGWIILSDGKTETKLLDIRLIRIPGRHNLENFMTAIALTEGVVDSSVYPAVAREFTGVAHRLEWLRRLDGVDYYNSSIDSSPSRTAAALSALHGRDIVVICGGYDKKIPFEPLAESLFRSARAVVLTGATGEKIGQVLRAHPSYAQGHTEVVYEADFTSAVLRARSLAKAEGCVLLSPACASFDAFKNFAERGDTFRKIVLSLESSQNMIDIVKKI